MSGNLIKIAHCFAVILREAIEQGKVEANGQIELFWDPENGLDGKVIGYDYEEDETNGK